MLWGSLRIFLLLPATLFIWGGVAVINVFVQQGGGGWILASGIVLSIGGCWLAWASLFGKRALIDKIFTEFVVGLLCRII